MKSRFSFCIFAIGGVLVTGLWLLPHDLLAQGALNPPGPPAPTMKTLDQVEPRLPISFIPTNLTLAGSYYLTTNLVGTADANGITVGAANAFIDLNGFQLIGVAGSRDGINASGQNLAVRNGVIRDWGRHGISATSANRGIYERLIVSNCATNGLWAGTHSAVERCIVYTNGGDGIRVGSQSKASGCISSQNGLLGFVGTGDFLDCRAERNGSAGFSGGGNFSRCAAIANGRLATGSGFVASSISTLSACLARGNSSYGIETANDSCTVIGCTAVANTNSGIFTTVSGNNTIKDCTAQENGNHGIECSTSSLIISCVVNGNATNGISGSAGMHVRDCSARSNLGQGIHTGFGSTIISCHVDSNTSDGIEVNNDCVVSGNTCRNNATGVGAGILLTGSDNRVENNNVTDNFWGIRTTASGSFIVKNSASGNTTNYSILGTQTIGPIVTATGTITTNNPWANFEF